MVDHAHSGEPRARDMQPAQEYSVYQRACPCLVAWRGSDQRIRCGISRSLLPSREGSHVSALNEVDNRKEWGALVSGVQDKEWIGTSKRAPLLSIIALSLTVAPQCSWFRIIFALVRVYVSMLLVDWRNP